MMESILIFSFKSVICSAIFVAYYMLVLKNAQMNSFNRVYLLSAAFLSLLLPFMKFQLLNMVPVAVPHFPLLGISGKGAEELAANIAAPAVFNWQLLLVIAYFTVSIVMVWKLVSKSVEVFKLRREGQQEQKEGYCLVKTDDPRAPFSFMNMLFWPTHMRHDSVEGNGIMMHELAHIKQHHTIDKLLMQLMLAVCWFNPLNWLIKKELWLQHEFLADRYAINDRDSETFALMLLYDVANVSNRSVISPFFQSPVKRRLLMLTQPARNTYNFLRRFMAVPILCTTVFLMSADTKESIQVSAAPQKIVMVLDAAHGGKDAGGKSVYGYKEKDITLALSKKLVALSREYNIEIVTTRDGDVNQALEQRINIGNGTDAAIFISLHVNKSTATDKRGNSYELGVNPNSKNYKKSILLASSIGSKLKSQKLPVKVVDQGKVYVLRDNRHPALLIECGNLDDADNMALLNDGARIELLCRNILSGIVDYNASLGTK